jgi:DNA-directed RNA polymerase subunit RPC12/RpoP
MFSRAKSPVIQTVTTDAQPQENTTESNQIHKQVKCSKCGTILTVVGSPDEQVTITCPACGTKGKAIIKDNTKTK